MNCLNEGCWEHNFRWDETMNNLFIALAFGAGFLAVFSINLLIADVLEANRQRVRKRLEEELQLRRRERARHSMQHQKILEAATEGLADLGNNATIWQRFARLAEESGVNVSPAQLVGLSAATALAAVLLVGVLFGKWTLAVLVGLPAAAVPLLYVWILRARRLEKLLSQLPDAFDLMSRTLRAGQTTSQALQTVADEFSPPIADEFGYCYDQQNLGLSPEAALRDLARRTGLLELKIFVLALMIHRQTGGNLADLLEKLAVVIRDRYRIRGATKALTADGRLQAIILLALPPAMLLILSLINRPYMANLFQYPILLVGMFVSMIIGGAWMKKIISFDF